MQKNNMCGILLVKSKNNIPIEKHLKAFSILKSRGPDFNRYRYNNNIFIGQTVLHITGDNNYYTSDHENFLAYNGEIYNASEFGYYNNDIEFVHDAVENNLSNLKNSWGTWAWAYSNKDTVMYASDPQGEKSLYRYLDNDTLIVCSEISPILEYIDSVKIDIPYKNKCWTIEEQTPWQGITRIKPGVLYKDTEEYAIIDSIFDWHSKLNYGNIDEAYDHFKSTWNYVISHMVPNCSASLSYSGGLDSNVILNSIDNLNLCAVDIVGKDPIVANIKQFLTSDEFARLTAIKVDTTQWGQEYVSLLERTKLPAQTWSHVGKWIVAKHCKDRVLFTGLGADELLGGYDLYKTIKYSTTQSHSPYSEYGDHNIWNRCMDVYNDPRQATLLMDYLYQVVNCDAMGMDSIAGSWGIETRNPFISKPMVQLAMNLPFEYKVGIESKPLVRRLFLERWDANKIYAKMGFAGHANDSFPTYSSTGNRHEDWKRIAIESFYEKN
jgi:asparagine synthase (glutamine-hydrolysing)